MELLQPTPEELGLSRKLDELAAIEAELAEKETALGRLESELRVFEVQYLATVGRRYAELDAIEAELAELLSCREPENAELLEQAEAARARAQESEDAVRGGKPPAEPRYGPPTERVKQLFRRVARLVHPDLAETDGARVKRQELMAAANRAYLTGDEKELALILLRWEESPEAVTGQNPAADLLRAVRQLAGVRAKLDAVDQRLHTLQESDLYRLRRRVEAAEAAGRDLLAEMATATGLQVEQARNRLAAVLGPESPP